MHSSVVTSLLAAAVICNAAPTRFEFYQSGGTTKLLGTAFGLIGKDATYDYVVSGILDTFTSTGYTEAVLTPGGWRWSIRPNSREAPLGNTWCDCSRHRGRRFLRALQQ